MTGTAPCPAELYDAHGATLFSFALGVLDDRDAAGQATVDTIAAAAQDLRTGGVDRAELLSALYLRCRDASARGGPGMQQRAAIALCRHGRSDYRWVAEVMGLSPLTVAGLLSSGLRQLPGPRSGHRA